MTQHPPTRPAAHVALPRLRRERKLDLPGLVGRFSQGIAAIDAQTEPYHQRWDTHNEQARHGDGPLWVALGDSSTQGVGASAWEHGWVHTILDRLRARTGERWRIVNLSMSGGRFSDVSERQVPIAHKLLRKPDLITCVIGGNDMMWRPRTAGIYSDAEAATTALPEGTFLSRVGGTSARSNYINEIFERAAAARDLALFSIWDWPTGYGAMAADRFHPGDIGYGYMADLVWDAIKPSL